jgi:histidine phosphatase superfamily protein (branch 1)
MDNGFPIIYIARHGETAWSVTGQHTGLTDLPLTPQGERNARALAGRLDGITFTEVFTSPLQRARRTCELAGFGPLAKVDNDLVEWNYGTYEGRRTAEIHAERPDWQLFRDGCPGGESPGRRHSASRTTNAIDTPDLTESQNASELLDQYGCGPIHFAGTDNGLYERHLLFDNVIALAAASERDRFEAFARSVRDILSQQYDSGLVRSVAGQREGTFWNYMRRSSGKR